MSLHKLAKTWTPLRPGITADNSWRATFRGADGALYEVVLQVGGGVRVTGAEYCSETGEVRTSTERQVHNL
jgi:hypothetical protein